MTPLGQSPRRQRRLPACHDLLDAKTRQGLRLYRKFGYIGVVISEALAYIELLEEELARRESMEGPADDRAD